MDTLVYILFVIVALAILVATFRTKKRRNDYTDPGHISGFQAIEALRRAKGKK